jgi:hypothetical protein
VPDVASVAGRPIPLSRLEERVAELRRGPRRRHLPPDRGAEAITLRRWLLQDLVTDEVLAYEARAAGLADDASAAGPADDARSGGSAGESNEHPNADRRPTLATAVRDGLIALVTADVSVPEAEVRAYYERNLDLYRHSEARRIRHVLVADEAEARAVRARVDGGGDIAELAVRVSRDVGTRDRGGDLGMVRRGELSGELEEAVFAAAAGDVIGPVHSEHGWHVARVEAAMPETVTPFAEVRHAIEAELLEEARGRVFGEWLAQRRAELAVIDPAYEHPGHPVHGTIRHRH